MSYQNAHKDMCAKEFMMLKDCYLVCVISMRELRILLTDHRKQQARRHDLAHVNYLPVHLIPRQILPHQHERRLV